MSFSNLFGGQSQPQGQGAAAPAPQGHSLGGSGDTPADTQKKPSFGDNLLHALSQRTPIVGMFANELFGKNDGTPPTAPQASTGMDPSVMQNAQPQHSKGFDFLKAIMGLG